MKTYKNISLKPYNTFGVDVICHKLVVVEDDSELHSCASCFSPACDFILGEGSNVLFTRDFAGTIVKLETRGIKIVKQSSDKVWIAVKAGENWDEFVRYCLSHHYYGLENLAFIPGTVGSSPVQNIGAYGAEVKDFISEVHVVSVSDGKNYIFKKDACEFAYRSSIFKTKHKNQFLIKEIIFELDTIPHLNISYPDLARLVESKDKITPESVYNAVVAIRRNKIPDYQLWGNAGSFFKNPLVSIEFANRLRAQYTDLKLFPFQEDVVKLSAAQLIEKSGWKGKKIGAVGVDDKQALILLNYGGAQGNDILHLAQKIQQSVYEKWNVNIEIEVNVF
jgi:UDP-N-acetylmuramate dehydrogenase